MTKHEPARGVDDGFEGPSGRAQRWVVLIGRAVLLAAALGLTSGIDPAVARTGKPVQAGTKRPAAQAMTLTVNTGGRNAWR
jgi:hypothetical protein